MKATALVLILLFGLFTLSFADAPPTGPWHSEITERPRLLYGPTDLEALRDRIGREPYATLMQRVRNRAASGYNSTIPNPYDAGREYTNANVAKSAAFVAWIDNDTVMAGKAADVLEVLSYENWNLYLIIDQDVHIAEAVIAYCQAYDTLAGTGLIDADRLAGIETRLATLVTSLYADYFDTLAVWQTFSNNNHSTKINSALSVAAMTLNQNQDANKWFSLGMTETTRKLFDFLVTDGGADAEGTYYGTYSAVNHLPFFMMYDRLVGEDMNILSRDFCLMGPNCNWTPVNVTNPMDHPKLREMSEWYVKIRMPDGAAPQLDDSNMEGFLNGMVAGRLQDSLLAWDWLNSEDFPLFAEHCSDLNLDLIATFDDSLPADPPPVDFGPSFIMNVPGEAVFRSGWGTDDTWVMFLAEYGQARENGLSHEHSDNLSLSLWARGEFLLLDPGYIAWEEHDVVRKGIHHNVPTVDGLGPPDVSGLLGIGGTDATIVDGATDAPVPFVRGISNWNSTDFDRIVFFPENDYLIVVDDMVSDTPHNYGVLWHGQGGGDSGFPFALLPDGASWQPGGAGVDVHVASTAGALDVTTPTNIHSFSWMQQIQHTSYDARASAATKLARFISIALPYAISLEEPRALTWVARDSVAAARVEGDAVHFVLAQADPADQQFTASETGSVDLETDLKTLLLSTDGLAETGYAFADGGRYLRIGDKREWIMNSSNRVWMDWTGDEWNFRFSQTGGMIATLCASPPAVSGDPSVHWYFRNGLMRIWSKEAAAFSVSFAASNNDISRSSNQNPRHPAGRL